ncbi:hypothetical protein, partial [Lysinibacillus xylanilyticus]|uniref:hypothetical protein n=1 Tax=Lysinibacillus xylanilyticus TaxID=582475 RepID=UPI0036DAD39B
MSEVENTQYQLVQMDDAERQELIEQRRFEINEQFTAFNKRLFEKVKSYLADAPNDIKMILALNSLLEREFNQHDGYPLQGFEKALQGIRNTTLLANNNFIYGENNIAEESAVYLVIEPEMVAVADGENYLTNADKVKAAIEIFELDEKPYKLYLFINTDKYDVYNALEGDLRSSISKDFELVSSLPNIDMRELADLTVDFFPEKSVNDMVTSFLTSFGLFSNRRKKVYFNYDSRTTGKAFGSLDFLLLAQSNLSNLLIKPEVAQPLAKHFTDLWLGSDNTYKFRYEEIEG